ncbi:MAG: alanine--tRNA ligase [Rhodospirillales bacterium]
MKSVNDIRRAFLEYFAGHGHEIVESSPLVPRNDPTLMFTNAGMVQFKNVFTGVERREYTRAASSQKCVRAGGKHNDLENVGYTARHHTFFEMLGNFSFGDYFKEGAIELAWRLINTEFGLPKDRLLVTVHSSDEEAAGFWKKVAGLSDDRIIRIPTSDNFWAMGETGPCGPCTEIFYDHGDHIPGGPPGSSDEDGDRFVEIWNLVFMQFEQLTPEKRVDLPKPCVDTGMGLERIAAVLQGTHDNYGIDLFRTLIAASEDLSGVPSSGETAVSHRVIADHLRASSFLIADGVLPSNEGRGYVLRRIMRRGMRHAHLLGCAEPLLWRLVPVLLTQMGQAFPELMRAQALIAETLKLEESRFKQTLDRGLKILDEETAKLGRGDNLAGELAFKLYDTYGFPLDLTQDALRPRGIGVDTDAFNVAMERQRAEARKAWAGSGEAATEDIWFAVREDVGATDFLGYETEAAEGQVTALIVNGARVTEAAQGDAVAIVVNQSPFYAESGGQVGDTGTIANAAGAKATVSDTQKKLGDLHVHLATLEAGPLKVGDDVMMRVDAARCARLRANHSATHLLHAALREVLGDHVTQKGSLVAPDRLRFDISHPKAIAPEELDRIEAIVNEQIRANSSVVTRLMDPDSAVAAGAMALFGEKYGDEVRVVSMGTELEAAKQTYSVELCGGTHARETGDIALFKIVGESAVAAGVRRIEGLTGEAARQYYEQEEAALLEVAGLLKASPTDVPARVAGLIEERRRLERELDAARRRIATGGGDAGTAETVAREVAGIKFSPRLLQDMPAKDLKGLADDLKKQIGSGVVALISVADGKASVVVGVTDDLMGRISAVDLVRAGSMALGGKGGGGRPDMAQAGGPDGARADEALKAIEDALANVAA